MNKIVKRGLELLLVGICLSPLTCKRKINLMQSNIDTTFEYLVRTYEIGDTIYYFQGSKIIGYEVRK